MTKTIREFPMAGCNQKVMESQTNISVPQQEGQTDAIEGNILADNKPDIDYKQEGSDLEM